MRKVEMLLETDEFLVTYDPSRANDELLIKTVKESGYVAQIVTDQTQKIQRGEVNVLPLGFPVLDKALAQAKAENKPIVVDFNAKWCVPCRMMEKYVFPDPEVAERLKKVVFVSIDTDKESELSEKLGVVGLPDIRYFTSEGRLVKKSVGLKTVEAFSKELDELVK